MSVRVDTNSLIPGAVLVGHRGLGVLGADIRSSTATGDHGPGYLYNDWDAGDDAREFRGEIITPPVAGTFYAYEDGSFSLIGAPDGAYSFVYRLYVDGVDLGAATASVNIGAIAASAFGALASITLSPVLGAAEAGISAAGVGPLAAITLVAPQASATASSDLPPQLAPPERTRIVPARVTLAVMAAADTRHTVPVPARLRVVPTQ